MVLWGECKQVVLCGRSWCTFVCKWHNRKRAVLRRLCSNPQSLADPESSQSAPAVLSRLCSSRSLHIYVDNAYLHVIGGSLTLAQ